MKTTFFLHLSFLTAFFSIAQNTAVTSLKYSDNYSNLETFWRSNPLSNIDGGDPIFSGGSSYEMGETELNTDPVYGFSSISTLDPIPIGFTDTQHKPQAKTWSYAGKWWCAIPPAQGGTWIFRLDGTTWTPTLQLATSGSRTDCWVAGDLIHILMFKGSGVNSIVTMQYDTATNTYKTWSKKPSPTNITLPDSVKTATLTVDGTGRMWVAADAVNDIFVWWSDSPYNTWSPGINVATGISRDDICAVTKLQGKIGIFWSNQNTGLFGFKTHTDGDSPTTWSADEIPASQSAIPDNPRMADDHMNLTVASNGTLYCVAKTNYNSSTLPQLILLVRRPAGTWDNLYPIGEGTQAIVLLNEVTDKIKIVYTSQTNGGQILYKEAPACCIIFSAAATLMGGPGANYNFASSTHQAYNPDVVIMATNQGSPQIVSVLASDASSGIQTGIQATVYPNPFLNHVTFCFTLSHAETYVIKLYDSKGSLIIQIDEGTAKANITKSVKIDGSGLPAGLYMVSIRTRNDKKVLKLVKE